MADETPVPSAPTKARVRSAQAEAAAPARVPVHTLCAETRTPLWLHEAAAALHGWGAHEHAFGEPMRLTAETYLAALEAAGRPGAGGIYQPHEPAMSAAQPRSNT